MLAALHTSLLSRLKHVLAVRSTLSSRLVSMWALALFAPLLIAGCAYKTGASATKDPKTQFWTGRISLRVASEPPQAFFAGFELKGNPQNGELILTSPIGSVLGQLRWTPDEAVMQSGSDVRRAESVDALLESATGAAVPVAALFDWLKGESTIQRGWTADLSQYDSGRIEASRTEPAPETRLRIVLDK